MNKLGMLLRGILDVQVLSLLAEKPMHGYAIILLMRKRFNVYFGPSTIYPLLAKIEHDGFAVSKWNMDGQRPQKMYELTPEGKNFLETSTMDLKMIVAPLLIAQ